MTKRLINSKTQRYLPTSFDIDSDSESLNIPEIINNINHRKNLKVDSYFLKTTFTSELLKLPPITCNSLSESKQLKPTEKPQFARRSYEEWEYHEALKLPTVRHKRLKDLWRGAKFTPRPTRDRGNPADDLKVEKALMRRFEKLI